MEVDGGLDGGFMSDITDKWLNWMVCVAFLTLTSFCALWLLYVPGYEFLRNLGPRKLWQKYMRVQPGNSAPAARCVLSSALAGQSYPGARSALQTVSANPFVFVSDTVPSYFQTREPRWFLGPRWPSTARYPKTSFFFVIVSSGFTQQGAESRAAAWELTAMQNSKSQTQAFLQCRCTFCPIWIQLL